MIGTTLGLYKILEPLGAGGMGEVYLGEDTRLGRKVAIKVLPAELAADQALLDRFIREAKTVARINHPGIVTLHSVEESDGIHFIVMEHVDGSTLDQLIGPDGMPLEEFFEVAGAVAAALEVAHEHGVVHRDLKPANIMVTDADLVKVLDFGIAKLQGDAAVMSEDSATDLMTRQGVILGTAPYMSPEQASAKPVDTRSDIFSLGIVLYEMASGSRPFQGTSVMETISSILKDAPTPLGERGADLPPQLARIVHRCLEKDPANRYQSSRELSAELRRLQQEIVHGRQPSRSGSDDAATSATAPDDPRILAPDTSHRWWGAGLAALATVGVLALVWYMGGEREPVTGSTPEAPRLAVLPFSNMRSDPETDFLGYALADQVIGSLTYVQDLTVRPSSSVHGYQNGDYDLDTIGDALAVNFVLAGNYLQQGDRMRLTVELIDLQSQQTVWTEPIEVLYQDAFQMQDLVSERLLARLEISFSEHERNRMTADVSSNPLAYEYYLRSLSYPEDAEGNRLAVDMLSQSTELDSTFAPTWGALGRRTQLQAYWELGGEEVSNRARELLLRAVAINPDLLSTLGHLTMLYTDTGETDLALEIARRTLEINPYSAEGLFAYGYVLRYAGMNDESVAAMTSALEIDPTNPTFKSAGYSFVIDGLYDEAIAAMWLGAPSVALNWEGEIAFRRGQFEDACLKWSQSIALDPEGIAGLSSTGLLSGLNGDYARGIEAARKWEAASLADGEGWYFLAGIYCVNGDVDKCISTLDKAVERGYFAYAHLLECRLLDAARGTPGLDAVLEKARLKHEAFKAKFF